MSDDDFHITYEHDVRFEETDAQGVVFFGNYVTFMDEALLAYWDEVGFPYDEVLEAGWEVYVAHVDMDYRDSARFGDHLQHAIRVSEVGNASLTFEYRCLRDGSVIATGSCTQVAVDADGETKRIPEAVRAAIRAYQDEPPVEAE